MLLSWLSKSKATAARRATSDHVETGSSSLRRRIGASWFETALARLLTMRV
jgi:hypothetical protein